MKSKIVWGVIVIAAAALLVAGAVNRTLARSDLGSNTAAQTAQQLRRGQTADAEASGTVGGDAGLAQTQGSGNGVNGLGQGQGQGQGRNAKVATGNEENLHEGQSAGQTGARDQGVGGNGATGALLADVEGLDTILGTVAQVDEETLFLAQDNGETLAISGRAWRFALENGFAVNQNDSLTVVGFYDGDHFEPIAITNEGTGQQLQVREANGRPMWAGQGRRNAGT